MFKLGGQADQGSGIMSTVEPRQNYMFGNIVQPLTPFQNTYTELPAYAYGGRIGYANGPGPVMPLPFGMSPVTLPKAGEKIKSCLSFSSRTITLFPVCIISAHNISFAFFIFPT